MKSGDRKNKYFSSLVKERLVGGFITKLYDEDDMLVSSLAYIAKVCNTFYSKLHAYPTPYAHREEICA
jgi:hypothetical protein